MATHNFAKRPTPAPWGNRIVRTGTAKAGSFLANPLNFRTHGFAQEDALSGLLTDVGFVQGVIVNLRTSPRWGRDQNVETLVDGHLRVKAALARDEDLELPVVWIDLEPEEERRVLATYDPIGALAGRDDEVLGRLVEDVKADWAESDLDLDAILKHEKKRAKGLAHDVRACTCCKRGCSPECGCYRESEPAADEAQATADGHHYSRRHAGKPPRL